MAGPWDDFAPAAQPSIPLDGQGHPIISVKPNQQVSNTQPVSPTMPIINFPTPPGTPGDPTATAPQDTRTVASPDTSPIVLGSPGSQPDGSTPGDVVTAQGNPWDDFAKPAAKGSTADNVIKGLGQTAEEVGQGATFGLINPLAAAAATPVNMAISALRGRPVGTVGSNYTALKSEGTQADKQARQNAPIGSAILNLAGGIAPGAAVESGIAKATGLANDTSMLGTVAKGAATGGALGAAYGAGGTDGKLSDRAQAGLKGLYEGAATGGALGGAAGAVDNVITPNVTQSAAQLAQRATKDFNIPLSLDQVGNSNFRNSVQKVSQNLPFSGQQGFQQAQRQAYNQAVAKTLGNDVTDLSPQSIKDFKSRIGDQFDSILKGNDVSVTPEALSAVDDTASQASKFLDDKAAAVVQGQVNDLKSNIGENGVIDGSKLASFRTQLMKNANKAGNASPYLNDLVDNINDIADTGLSGTQSQELGQIRNQWRNYKTIAPLLEKSTDGEINPTQLLNQVANNKYINAGTSPVGKDDLVDLAKIGKQFMPVKEGSDTAYKGAVLASMFDLPFTAAVAPGEAAAQLAGTGGILAANRAFQSGVNRNQGLVNRAINRGLSGMTAGDNLVSGLVPRSQGNSNTPPNSGLVGSGSGVVNQAVPQQGQVITRNPSLMNRLKGTGGFVEIGNSQNLPARNAIPTDSFGYQKPQPLSNYAQTLYHETSLDGLAGMLRSNGPTNAERFYSNTPDLATGQGANQGVMVTMKPDGLNGVVNLSKPGGALAYDNGAAEFITRGTRPGSTEMNNIQGIEIMKGAQGVPSSNTAVQKYLRSMNSEDLGDRIRYTPKVNNLSPVNTIGSVAKSPLGIIAGTSAAASAAAGISAAPHFVDKLTRGVESNGQSNAKNPNSSALGPYQITRATFASLVKKYDPQTYQQGNFQHLRTDPAYSRQMAINLAQENEKALASQNLPINDTTRYLAHFAGDNGAIKILKASANAPIEQILSPSAIQANPFLRGKNVAQTVQWAQKAIARAG